MLKLENVRTQFGQNVVHENLSLEITRPGVHAIIGESGCGKSVLLREIIGLLKPSSGKITLLNTSVWDADWSELRELKKRFAVLFQDSALFSALTVSENVACILDEALELETSFKERLINLKLELSGLDPKHGKKYPSELSGGMRKRAALARALALDPEVLFLDEPTSGLDPITSRNFDRVIRTLADGLQLTVLLVTHDIDTILDIVDNLIVLGVGGKVIAHGPVSEVTQIEHPWIQKYFSTRSK